MPAESSGLAPSLAAASDVERYFRREEMTSMEARAMLAVGSGYGDSIMWGDGLLNDVAYGRVKGRLSRHPLDRQLAALNALERAPDLFEKRYIRLHTGPGERLVRTFRLIGTPRPLDTPSPGDSHAE